MIVLIFVAVICFMHKVAHREYKKITHWKMISELYAKWVLNLQRGNKIQRFFDANEIKTVAIAGCNMFSYLIIRELVDSDVQVVCCIDDRDVKHLKGFIGVDVLGYSDFCNKAKTTDAVIDAYNYEDRYYNTSKYWERLKNDYDGKLLSMTDLMWFTGED